MRGYTLYMWLGVWLFLLPFLGIPGSWKETLLILTALFLMAHSFIGHRRNRLVGNREAVSETEEKTEKFYAEDKTPTV